MLAAQTYELTRDEIVALIEEKCARLHESPALLYQAYLDDELVNFSRVSDILALMELLEEDDPIFSAA